MASLCHPTSLLPSPPQRAAVCQTGVSPVALPLLEELCVPQTLLKEGSSGCATPPMQVCELLELQPGSGCASTRSALDPSFWQCHRLQSNYSSHELDPVHALKLPQLTAKVQTVTQCNHSHVSLTPDYALKITVSYESPIKFSQFISFIGAFLFITADLAM